MADMNRWTRTLERRTLQEVYGEVVALRSAARGRNKDEYGQRRMATRIMELIAAKIEKLDEEDERADSWSSDDIDEGLKA